LVDVDVMVERAAERGGIAPRLPRHPPDPGPLLAELPRAHLVGHPAVGQARHAAEARLDHRVGGAGAPLPGEAGGVAGDPDGTGLLDRARLDPDAVELVEAALIGGLLAPEQEAQDRDAFLEPGHPLARAYAHRAVLEGLGSALLVGPAQAHR